MKVTICNWEKFNPRNDYKSIPWFRCDANLGTSSDLFGLSAEQKWVWITLLCEVAKRNGRPIDAEPEFIAHLSGASVLAVKSAIEHFEEKQMLKVTHVRDTNVTRTPHVRDTNVELQSDVRYDTIRNERNDTIRNERNSKPSRKRDVTLTDHDIDLGSRWAAWTAAEYSFLKPDIRKYAEAIAKVRKAVGLNDEQLDYLLEFVKGDPFWSQNCQSPGGLLKKSKNELRKIDNILAKIKAKVEPDMKASRWAADLDAKEAELGRSLTLEEQILYAER